MPSDPFEYHPGLRDKIADPETSFFRNITLDDIAALMDKHGLPKGWWTPEEDREAHRRDFMKAHKGDLWMFAYGSLMWDPGVYFTQVRRAVARGYTRRFIMRETYGGRGSLDQPGLMAALDVGDNSSICEGLAFRIEATKVEAESKAIWAREMLAPAYHARMIPVSLGDCEVQALTFVADRDSDQIIPNITCDEKIHHITTGKGVLGTSREYLENLAAQFALLGIHDQEVSELMERVREPAASQ